MNMKKELARNIFQIILLRIILKYFVHFKFINSD